MPSKCRHRDGNLPVRRHRGECHPVRKIVPDVHGAEAAGRILSHKVHGEVLRHAGGAADQLLCLLLPEAHKIAVVPVQDGIAALSKAAEDLALAPEDVLAASEEADVGIAHVGDGQSRGLGDLHQVVDLPPMVHAHLDHRDLGAAVN